MPKISIDFFQVKISPKDDGPVPNLQQLLLEIHSRDPAVRSMPVSDGWINLLSLSPFPTAIAGVFLKAKADEIPPLASRSGRLEDITLNDDQGLAGLTHFYYRPTNRILLLQRNMRGVRGASFEKYFRQMTGFDVELQVVLQANAMRRLQICISYEKSASNWLTHTQELGSAMDVASTM